MPRFTGRSAIVTPTSRGIGAVIPRRATVVDLGPRTVADRAREVVGSVVPMPATVIETSESVPDRSDPRFHRLLEATRRAARDGYDAVSMRDLAREAKMSLNTVYKFCSSKDQLIAEAHAELMEDFRVALSMNPPRGRTAEKRVKVVLRGIAGALERDELRTRALMRSIYSGGEGVAVARQAATGSYEQMVAAAMGDEDIADRAAVIATLGHVINSVILNWLNNGWDSARVASDLDDAARLLLGPSSAAAVSVPTRKR